MMTSTDQQPPVPTGSDAAAAVLSDEDEAVRQTLLNAAHLWSSFDLTSRRPQLAQTATQARENREQSQSARKLLGEQTKRFKKSVKSTEAAASSLSTLASSIAGSDDLSEGASAAAHAIELLAKEGRSTIKSYQEEIDNLTRRCKFSDGAFAGLHGALADLPDPAGVLPAAVGRIEEAAASTDRLRSELREAGVEIDALREEVDLLREEQKRRDEAGPSESQRDNEGTGESQKQSSSSSSGLGKPEREELLQLRREVAEYEVEFRSLQNQDITIRKLEARIVELQRSSEEEFADRMERFQREIEEEQGRRVADALEREAATERRCAGLELELKAERAGRHATQNRLFEQGEGLGEREAAWEAQRSILVDDAERLREALHDATRERDELRLRAAALESASSSRGGKKGGSVVDGGDGSDPAVAPAIHASPSQDSEEGGASGHRSPDMALERRAYEAEVSELTETNAALRQELRASEEAAAAERANLRGRISTLEGERDDAVARAATLADEVSAMPSAESIEAMRRELRILKRLEYNASDADGLEDHSKDPEMTTTTTATSAAETGDKDLETVLVDRLRKAEADLLRERREKAEGEDRGRELARQLSSLRKEKAEADDLVARLESDLHRAIATPAAPGGGSTSVTSSVPLPSSGGDPAALQRILDPSGAPSPVAAPVAPKAAPPATTEKDNDDHSVVTIVMAQRDRLRARCDALEAERDGFKRELQEQVRSADSLKADNTKLYEKVRYLQNYASKQPGGGGGGHNNPVGSRTSDLDLEALEERYEASVDPFRQFSRAERQRKLREMSPMERIVFVTAKTVLATKQLRAALFFYVLGMHLLVFITTHHWSHGSTNCHAALNEHPDFAHLHHGVPRLEEATPPLPLDGGVGGVN